MNRRIILSCVVLLSVICVVLSIVSTVFAGVLLYNRGSLDFLLPSTQEKSLTLPTEQSTQTPHAGDDSPLTTSPSTSPEQPEATSTEQKAPLSPEGELDPEILRQMEEIENQMVEIRGLHPMEDVNEVMLTPQQLRQRLVDDFQEDYTPEEVEADTLTLAVFGLLDPEYDLYNSYLDLLTEQVAGIYDQEIKEMIIVQGEGFEGPERLTYAHEYIHALQDQTYNIEEGLNFTDEECEQDSEYCAAVQALLEGDATLSQIYWFSQYATAQDQTDIFEFYDNIETPMLNAAPAFLRQDFLFPYEQGLAFVQFLYDRGGWEAVNSAYEDLPVSTEQILHPESYPEDKPLRVELPDLTDELGPNWEKVDQDVLGEWYTYLVLAYGLDPNARLLESQAQSAAQGWGGDAFAVYYNSTEETTALVLTTIWDSTTEADEFSNAFRIYATERFGSPPSEGVGVWGWETDQGYTNLHINDETTTWILAPNEALTQTIWDTLK